MNTQLFEKFRGLIFRESGISLGDDKIQLLTNRVNKRLKALKIRDPEEYLRVVELDESGDELVRLIDVVSTNVTYFYREPEHFKRYAEILRQLSADGQREIRVWCAACSSGEEAYMLSMMAKETLDLSTINFKLLATDISIRVLEKAVLGLYDEKQLEKLPDELRSKYFRSIQDQSADIWRVDPALARAIVFKRLNLSSFPYPLKGGLDMIFCRNVMIYFAIELRQKVIDEFAKLLRPGGYLFLGHSENLLGIKHDFESKGVSTFRKPDRQN